MAANINSNTTWLNIFNELDHLRMSGSHGLRGDANTTQFGFLKYLFRQKKSFEINDLRLYLLVIIPLLVVGY